MKIKDKYYSEATGDTFFQVHLTPQEYALFSEFQDRTSLEDVKSHRGLGRSLLLGGLSGAAGGYVGKIAANDADESGLSNKEILKKAQTAGAVTGAATGIAQGLISKNPSVRAASIALGATGGFLGARKNTKSRLKRRDKIDSKKNNGL